MRIHEVILTESINITEIETQLINDIEKRLKRDSPTTLDQFSGLINDVFIKSTKLFLDHMIAVVDIIKFTDENSSGWFKFRKHDYLVKFGFHINKNLAEQILNTTPPDVRNIRVLVQNLSHELLHAIQFDRSTLKSAGEPSTQYKKHSPDIQYYSTKEEIEAYAMNSVQEIENAGMDSAKLLEMFNNSDYPQSKLLTIIKKVSPSFNHYYDMFSNKNEPMLNKAWKRFIKKFIYNLTVRTEAN